MKKMAILGVVLLVLIFDPFVIGQQKPPELQTSASVTSAIIEITLKESVELCQEVKLTNTLLKTAILSLMRSKDQNPEKQNAIGHLISNVEKAEKLIKENEKSLATDNFWSDPAKLIKLKDNFQEINDLHLKAADGLNALPAPEPKMVPTIEI